MAAELKTKLNDASVEKFIGSVKNETMRDDCYQVMKIMKQITRKEPKMWGASIVGFGSYHYKYASGREGDWFEVAFSPRKQSLTLYVMNGIYRHKDLLKKLGPHKTGKGCLYIKSLGEIDKRVLKEILQKAVTEIRSKR